MTYFGRLVDLKAVHPKSQTFLVVHANIEVIFLDQFYESAVFKGLKRPVKNEARKKCLSLARTHNATERVTPFGCTWVRSSGSS